VKKEATHRKHCPEFMDLQQEGDRALLHCAQTTMKSRCSWPAPVRSSGKWTKQHKSFTKLSLEVYRREDKHPKHNECPTTWPLVRAPFTAPGVWWLRMAP
jgi:hypothetical protein